MTGINASTGSDSTFTHFFLAPETGIAILQKPDDEQAEHESGHRRRRP